MPSALLEFYDKLLAATLEENITQVLFTLSVFNVVNRGMVVDVLNDKQFSCGLFQSVE